MDGAFEGALTVDPGALFTIRNQEDGAAVVSCQGYGEGEFNSADTPISLGLDEAEVAVDPTSVPLDPGPDVSLGCGAAALA